MDIVIPVIRHPDVGVEYMKECPECLAMGCWECDETGYRQLTEDEEIAVYQMLEQHRCKKQ
jgi:hypothetical protein